jgi:hypothetical protein
LPSSTSIILSNSSASSSKVSFDLEDEGVSSLFYASIMISISFNVPENDTITSGPAMVKRLRKRKSQE